MIEKSVFEKKINQGSKKQKIQQKANNNEMKKTKFLKDISNQFQCPQNLANISDYKTLYESQVEINQELREKIELLQQKVRLLQQQNKQLRINKQQKSDDSIPSLTYINTNKKSKKELFFEEIRSFKGNLPNSMRFIQLEDLNAFESINLVNDDEQIMSKYSIKIQNGSINDNQANKQKLVSIKYNLEKQIIQSSLTMKILNDDSLVDCLCLYGLSQEPKFDEQLQESFLQGELKYCSKTPHQIVKHAASLMYPKRLKQNDLKMFQNDEAVQNAVNLVTDILKSQLKAFTLIFQPAMLKVQDNQNQIQSDDDFSEQKDIDIIDLVNKQKRFYAISLSFQDFDIIHQSKQPKMDFQNSLQQDIYNHKMKLHQNVEGDLDQKKINKKRKSQEMKSTISHTLSNQKSQNQKQQQYKIRQSRKILTILTKYPFIPFFQQLLVGLLKESFQLRKQAMRRNLSQLCNFEHSKTIEFIKIFYQKLNKQYRLSSKFEYKINEIFEIKYLSARMNRMESIFLELSKSQLKNYYSEIWAYPILRLFTLDSFLDTLTLILLEEKVIFVCENQHVLTSTVFLFIKVLMQPFNYPYPVVSIIPNQYDYFNAPFPIVYGTINSRQNLIKEKIPKIYQNVYIVLSPQGIQIVSHKNYSSKIQSVKSPKLRDKLLPLFIKMENLQKQFNPPKQTKQPRFSGLSSFFGFKTISPQPNEQNLKFIFSNNNRQLAYQIIEKVFLYLNAIKQKLPEQQKVNQVRKQIQFEIKTKTFTGDLKNLDLDKQTYERIKNKLSKKTQDPFIIKFLSTQIVGMQILK